MSDDPSAERSAAPGSGATLRDVLSAEERPGRDLAHGVMRNLRLRSAGILSFNELLVTVATVMRLLGMFKTRDKS